MFTDVKRRVVVQVLVGSLRRKGGTLSTSEAECNAMGDAMTEAMRFKARVLYSSDSFPLVL